MSSLQEVSVAELAEVNGGFLLLAVGLVAMVAIAEGMKDCGPADSSGITNFEYLGITPPK